MTREEMVTFCVESSKRFETDKEVVFSEVSDYALGKFVELFEYLWESVK